jgi:CDP-diacylglycerol--serine O-phosphatidyltransferase
MKVQQYVPNFLTSCNLVCGFIAIVLALDSQTLPIAPWFIFIAAVFDFSDGFAARLFKAYSELGKQLDSLADMVSFGVAPGVIIYKLMQISYFNYSMSFYENLIIIVLASFIPVFSALRLAKFNIDERQTSSFIGLPTPASAILVASLCLVFFRSDNQFLQYVLANKYSLGVLVVLDSFLMVSELPMFSLKIKGLQWNGHEIQFIFLIVSVLLLLVLKLLALPLIIITYILISLLLFMFRKKA